MELVLTLFTTFLSSLFAVKFTRWLDQKNKKRDEQVQLFQTLWATRMCPMNYRHVEALNMIDIIFHSQKKITESWGEYLYHLKDKKYSPENWEDRRVDLLSHLLREMSVFLRFDFGKIDIKDRLYWPQLHSTIENNHMDQNQYLLEILKGERPLKIQNIN